MCSISVVSVNQEKNEAKSLFQIISDFYEGQFQFSKKVERYVRFCGISFNYDAKNRHSNACHAFMRIFVLLSMVAFSVRLVVTLWIDHSSMSENDRVLYLGDVGGLLAQGKIYRLGVIAWLISNTAVLFVFAHGDSSAWFDRIRNLHFKIAQQPLLADSGDCFQQTTGYMKRVLFHSIATASVFISVDIVFLTDVALEKRNDLNMSIYVAWSSIYLTQKILCCAICFFSCMRFVACCRLIGNAFKLLNQNFKAIAQHAKKEQLNDEHSELFHKLVLLHQDVSDVVELANDFWKKYLFVFYATLVPLLCFLLYNFIFRSLSLLLRVAFFDLVFGMAIFIVHVSVVTAEVHEDAHGAFAHVYQTVIYQRCGVLKLQGMTMLQRLGGQVICFYFYNYFAITRTVLTNIFSFTLTYLFVISDSARFRFN